MKKYYVLKLIPPRATFAFDMTEEEKAIMQQHVAYWTDLLNKGIAIIFGPVADTKGGYGLGIIEVDSEEQVKTLIANDPAAKLGGYEISLMLRAVVRK